MLSLYDLNEYAWEATTHDCSPQSIGATQKYALDTSCIRAVHGIDTGPPTRVRNGPSSSRSASG